MKRDFEVFVFYTTNGVTVMLLSSCAFVSWTSYFYNDFRYDVLITTFRALDSRGPFLANANRSAPLWLLMMCHHVSVFQTANFIDRINKNAIWMHAIYAEVKRCTSHEFYITFFPYFCHLLLYAHAFTHQALAANSSTCETLSCAARW